IDIQHLYAVELSHLVEIEVVGHDLTVVDLGQLDQLHVDFVHIGEVVFEDLHVQLAHFLDSLQNVESPAAPVPLQGIGGIGDQLQFAQHKLWDDQRAVQESGFYDVGDAPVDDNAGIENLERLTGCLFPTEQSPQGSQ